MPEWRRSLVRAGRDSERSSRYQRLAVNRMMRFSLNAFAGRRTASLAAQQHPTNVFAPVKFFFEEIPTNLPSGVRPSSGAAAYAGESRCELPKSLRFPTLLRPRTSALRPLLPLRLASAPKIDGDQADIIRKRRARSGKTFDFQKQFIE